jgi:hypothetical protein
VPPFDRPVRIANCSGFYGDRLDAARQLVQGGPIDVLTGDYLAELTMLLLTRERATDPTGGFARTFLAQLRDVLAPCLAGGIRIVSNAGGVNPQGLADAIQKAASAAGLSPRIAVVSGDDVKDRLDGWREAGVLRNLDTGLPLRPADGLPLAANAYLGAWGIAEALRRGADIVITGRVTDAATVIGPAAWAHGWAQDDWDALAGALVAGHIIECGTQASGGNYAFFDEVPSFTDVGFPIAEIAADGSSIITKHPGTGGLVSVGTVTAQLVYEIGGWRYASPDVVARLDTLQLHQEGPDRVSVRGTRGEAPSELLKAGVLLATGWRNEVTLLVGGAGIEAKARLIDQAFWPTVGGKESFQLARTDLFRGDHPDAPPLQRLSRVVLSARDPDANKVGRAFTAKAIELALCSVPGLTLDALPGKPRPCGVFWPCLVPRDDVPHLLQFDGESTRIPDPPAGGAPEPLSAAPALPAAAGSGRITRAPLGLLVGARSGDKGGNANVGFWVRDPGHHAWLCALLTPERLRTWLGGFDGELRIHPLPNLLAVNVELVGWLDRGVLHNLAPDPQAKCLAECLRTVEVEVDAAWVPAP